MPIPTPDSNINTVVKCFQDFDHEDYGHLCIEGYTLAGYDSPSLCFANWDDQRCTSCTHVEHSCPDMVASDQKGGFQLSCSNLFPDIPSMTVCGDQIFYHRHNTYSRRHVIVSVVFALVAFRVLTAVYCRRGGRLGLGTSSHRDEDDNDKNNKNNGSYRTVPVTDELNHHRHDDDDDKGTTELTSVHQHLSSMRSEVVVV
mmetsp:Transcript_5799/g.11327  ORF Transcript_5799/g.11327 Transcript_5799/m.11327 type:complete len:200 (-) Transcript_5799:120-719(-)|eukprot:scaffold1598_cov192-Amphora_coffeaeformis.AAC.3